ncbi:MAG: response regulator [Planctomycetes bacterium]|nr:response regulator [Planctomycetota bacterium]
MERDPAGLDARIAQLEKALRVATRDAEQVRRQAERAENFALRSKQAMLGMHKELQATVTDLEQLTRELSAAKVAAERASEAKGRFVATISHELRTPMNGILGTAELLLQESLSPDQSELVQVIHRSSRGLLSLINDVLDFTKAESNRIEIERIRFDLHKVLHAVIDLEANAAHAKAVRVLLEIDAVVPRWVVGDPVRLRQVLLNLLDNAIKFTERGEVKLEAHRAQGDPELLEFRIRDSGIGIPPHALASIFEPFTQADSSTTRRFGGTGLGLAICKRLVQLMGGEIGVDSVPDHGSTFRFQARLPAAAAGDGSLAETSYRQAPSSPLSARVLVVDDNPVNRLIATRMLERLGCSVLTVADGAEAVKRVADEDFDAVFMDCSMPGMDGYQATAAIRALPKPRRSVRVIAMTAHALSGDRQICLEAGMDDYLSKPMELAKLRAKLVENLDARTAPALPAGANSLEQTQCDRHGADARLSA